MVDIGRSWGKEGWAKREEFNIKLLLDYFSLEESGGMSVPLAANGIILVAIGYEIAPLGDNHTTYMCGTEKKIFFYSKHDPNYGTVQRGLRLCLQQISQ